ncbi:MAG: methylated-DNA--[protein]-cysteine S-methyltransferase [Nitrospiraceae bacterium]
MTPQTQIYRNRLGQCLAIFKTRWGWASVAASPLGVCALRLPESSRSRLEASLRRDHLLDGTLGGTGAGTESGAALRHLKAAQASLVRYLAGDRLPLRLTLDAAGGTPFQQAVWRALQRIPYGAVRSYGWVAQAIGRPHASRAVGGACGANPVPILVPCHRVVAGNGSLGGFSCGLDAKERLLKLEGSWAQVRPKKKPARR